MADLYRVTDLRLSLPDMTKKPHFRCGSPD